jgi:translocator protein
VKANYLIIPLIAVFTAVIGGLFTSSGMDWYRALNLPAWTPPGAAIGAVWTIIYTLTVISALIVWNSFQRNTRFSAIIALFLLNAVLNAGWSWVFFARHQTGLAIFEAAALELTVLGLIFLIAPASVAAAALLFPYAAWTLFAAFLTYKVHSLN